MTKTNGNGIEFKNPREGLLRQFAPLVCSEKPTVEWSDSET
jgi:hypothetical protein